MSINAYDVGDLIQVSAVFKNAAASAVDPTVVMAKIRKPDGTFLNYTYGTNAELVRDALGTFHVNVNGATAGKYRYRFYSTGTGQAAGEQMFVVQPSALD